ncbi:TetR/AcrR family transcriptional regulator [Christensenella hongkongensis]|uniref:TetR/AcrR family transcriptional regulator n=1 Tax=Christensenella hongkongensis TaxID=270498 RepID=UPI0026731852|nr:TetR/AcrR family transcriptional regulator [Christensenella hongkongensis]
MTKHQSSERIREKLVRAGIKMIKEGGPGHLSMRGVAKLCNMTPRAPYNHFRNVQELLMAIRESVIFEIAEELKAQNIHGIDDPVEKLLVIEEVCRKNNEKYGFLLRMPVANQIPQYCVKKDMEVNRFIVDYPYSTYPYKKRNIDVQTHETIVAGAVLELLPAVVPGEEWKQYFELLVKWFKRAEEERGNE